MVNKTYMEFPAGTLCNLLNCEKNMDGEERVCSFEEAEACPEVT